MKLLRDLFARSADWEVHQRNTGAVPPEPLIEFVMRRWKDGQWEYRQLTAAEKAKREAEAEDMTGDAW